MSIDYEIERYVMDTNAVISYFKEVFNQPSKISRKAINLINKAFDVESNVRISIPSMAFIEIYDNLLNDEEILKKFRLDVFVKIKEASNFEIKSLEKEVIENILKIKDDYINLENHDKIFLASAMMLKCPLITSDVMITDYVKYYKVIPAVIN